MFWAETAPYFRGMTGTPASLPSSSQEAMDMENQYGAHNYHPLPVVLDRAEGVYCWDI